MDDDTLWAVYSQVIFRPVAALPQADPFMIITADYPQGLVLSEELREQREIQLYERLKHNSQPCRLYGCSTDLKHCELSFAVANISLDEALHIGRDYRQNAIYAVQSGGLYLHSCLMAYRPPAALGAFAQRIVADECV